MEIQADVIQEFGDVWAVVELMGHARTAGRISQPGTWGAMLRVDVPDGDGYRTEFYGLQSIYSIKLVSEEIARAYAAPSVAEYAYNEPIVPRDMYERALRDMRNKMDKSEDLIRVLRNRLTSVDENEKGVLPGIADGSEIPY